MSDLNWVISFGELLLNWLLLQTLIYTAHAQERSNIYDKYPRTQVTVKNGYNWLHVYILWNPQLSFRKQYFAQEQREHFCERLP